jgi:8-oxo-dGTP pyrophosphatase MutT (NUDIX family)
MEHVMSDWFAAARELTTSHGKPLDVRAAIPDVAVGGFDGPRQAEVCMVLRHGAAEGDRYAVMTKPFYPPGIWRLPTGGIEAGESILEGFARELLEETGLVSNAPRFLAHIAYEADGEAVFHTFALLVEWDGAPLAGTDDGEEMTFARAGLDELAAQVERMALLEPGWSADLEEDWAAWGWQRATMQRAVIEGLGRLK